MQSITTEAEHIAQEVAAKYKPEKIILFGSAARGDCREDSDIDQLIIKPSSKKRVYRIKEVFELLRSTLRTYPLDVLVYTPEEIQKRISIGDYFIKQILSEGKVLYG